MRSHNLSKVNGTKRIIYHSSKNGYFNQFFIVTAKEQSYIWFFITVRDLQLKRRDYAFWEI